MSLSLVTIVKNEEKFLARALDSVRAHVDEMIIVDTGSTDKTKEIAAGYGATVLDFKWRDDFSAARNHGLEAATSDWIIALDADEELVLGHQLLPELTTSEQYDLFLLGYEVGSDPRLAGTGHYSKHSVPRLFRNHPDIRYFLPIHENPSLPDRTRGCFCHHVTILHFGPALDSQADTMERARRNITILESAIEKQPDEGFFWVHLAGEHMKREELLKARTAYRQAIDLSPLRNDHYVPSAFRDLAACTLQMKDFDAAAATISEATKLFPDYTDLLFLEGELNEAKGDLEAAERSWELCLELGDPGQKYDSWGGTGSWRASQELARIAGLRS